jgi:hypothetical protein
MPKIQPAVTDLLFRADTANQGDSRSYIDTARELSKINRRMYSQGRLYAYQGLTFIWNQNPASSVAIIEVTVRTAGNTWSVQNAHVKGEALWHQMQELVLEDNPSIAGKWHDFKVQLCGSQASGRELGVLDGAGVAIKPGSWDVSTFVMPQHEVDPVTGEPLAAVELTGLLVGPDTASKRSLVTAYELSRATVQTIDPNVPAGLVDSFFNLLTDSGSQEPELATVILAEGDAPPYDIDEYVGGATNGNVPLPVQYGAISASEVDGKLGGFVAPCGLLEIEIKGFKADGTDVLLADMPTVDLLLHLMPGTYKGVSSIPMGQ